MSHSNGNGHAKPLTPEMRATLVASLRKDADELRYKGFKQEAVGLMVKASEVELKVGEGPYKNVTKAA